MPQGTSEAGTSVGEPAELPSSLPEAAVDRLVPTIPFEQWPFELLEVEMSTAKRPDYWAPMDKGMAEMITQEAQSGDHSFMICYGTGNKWKYMIDFNKWMQTNAGTGTTRKFRFRML
jgi:hypothetical protein